MDSIKDIGIRQFKNKNYTEAIDYFNQVLADLSDLECLVLRSSCNCKIGKFDEALADANEAITINPLFVKVFLFRSSFTSLIICILGL